MKTPHDDFFHLVFSEPENAAGELKHLLPPEVTKRIDWTTLQKLHVNFIDEEFSRRRADVAFSVKLDGRQVVLYLLLEHQSTSDDLMGFRLLSYMVRLWNDYLKDHPKAKLLPAVVPMVVHHSEDGWKAPRQFHELLDLEPETLKLLRPLLPRFEYLLDDLSAAESAELRSRVMTALGRLTLLSFSQARRQVDLMPKLLGWQELLLEASAAPNGVAALAALVRYILHTSETKPEETRQLFRQLGPRLEEAFMTGAQILTQEARAEGEAKGKAEGKAEIVLKQLTLKFGALSAEQTALVQNSSVEELERFAERVIMVDSLDDVFAR